MYLPPCLASSISLSPTLLKYKHTKITNVPPVLPLNCHHPKLSCTTATDPQGYLCLQCHPNQVYPPFCQKQELSKRSSHFWFQTRWGSCTGCRLIRISKLRPFTNTSIQGNSQEKFRRGQTGENRGLIQERSNGYEVGSDLGNNEVTDNDIRCVLLNYPKKIQPI